MSDTSALSIDIDDLTIEEVEMIEEALDLPIDKAFGADQKKGRALRVLAWIAARREDPAVTLEEVGSRRLKIADSDPS